LTRKVFTKLLGLFLLLMVLEIAAVELVVRPLTEHSAAGAFHRLALEVLWSGLIALAAPCPLPLGQRRISARLKRIGDFARRMADGDLKARIAQVGADELPAMEAALNQSAEQLGQSFAEIETGDGAGRMLDSMQEAVVAITSEAW